MHELVECQQFFTEKTQPFILFMTIESLILLSVQSHLHRNEVIGFLSGFKIKNRSNKDIVIIHEAHPCVAAVFDEEGQNNVDYSKNVEMEPESASKKVEMIKAQGQTLLGWYHSHPKFEVNPSHIDVVNHNMY